MTTEAVVTEDDSTQPVDSAAPEINGPDDAGHQRLRPVDCTPRARLARFTAAFLLPALAVSATLAAGYFKYQNETAENTATAGAEALTAARETTTAILAYTPDTVEQTLAAARERLTGQFHDEYIDLMNSVVIPGAKERRVVTVTAVTAAGIIHAEPDTAIALLYVNQSATAGTAPPTDSATTVKVTLNKVDGRWLVSGFEPI